MVCRTFSKVCGLAGMRIGYAVAVPDLVRRVSTNRLRNSVSIISAKAAAAALDDDAHVRFTAKRNADDRQEFVNQVNARMLH